MPHADMEALGLLEESECLLRAILLGVGMQLRSLELERCRLLGDGNLGDDNIRQLQLSATLLSVWGLMGFWRQSMSAGDSCEQSLGSASLIIGLMRLMRQLAPKLQEPVAQDILQLAEPLD